MTNNIGEKIKNLRKKSNVTQEKFAEYLGVTFQSVSRWENGVCYPDLEILPAIANYFSVTTDELLGVDILNKQEKIKEIRDRVQLNFAKGLVEENIAICRNAVNEFPNDYGLLNDLAFYLGLRGNINNDEEARKESLSIFERILADCTDESIRWGTIQFLAYRYKESGEQDKAIETAKKLSHISCGTLLSQIYSGGQLIEHLRQELTDRCDMIRRDIEIFAYAKYKGDKDPEGAPQRIKLFDKAISIFEILFECGDYGFYNERMAYLHEMKAASLISLNDFETALDCLEKAADYTIAFDNLPDIFINTSLIFEGYEYSNTKGLAKDHKSNNSYEMLRKLGYDLYDAVRGHERFKSVTAKLEKYAEA